MSVPKSRRDESDVQFLYSARELELYTIKKCANFPKRYTFYVGQPIAALASSIHDNVKRANSIYPLNQHEVQIRRDYLLRALADTNALASKIEVAAELFDIEGKTMRYWGDLVERELRLIKGALKRDSERYKYVP